ncbi:hypothetical protein BpOF4_15780 [Alkalihalophilus pseudofirmus OF4]|jgi:hypothetical protein|uniref:Uncharacterized protein n=3 Tax=Alkalihalophilus TaxID=2893060 RepID=D3G0P3_ALKPO|nr:MULTISPECIES: hypothetical protein [Alkalihalophilus]ADC51205.1 hypothetical protein BpOF4_15780 [Alkalihalophilus pseudofirmus OF4]ERN54247.1 hypothetical protein A33I_07415 [Alkalihalophilus marmarensis DSM 21297]MCM3488333.1 hypothetical protein [Alkalihalophilus marmarensis]MDV2884395.1 hypothetical protein [Alkalihalophilus pseudofirmus]MED1601794.1 hypothetical protein [Alkalihalophilus marmarensis]
MNKEEIIQELEKREMEDILELIEDAEKGYLEELEIVPSVGLLYDRELNEAIISLLKEQGVEIIYVTEEE